MKKLKNIFMISLISILCIYPNSILAKEKSETVYANLDPSGKSYNTIVNNHIVTNKNGELKDDSNLLDILNINGDEKFNLNNNEITWEALGKDIYYQGKTDKVLPITINAKYYLDKKEVDPKKIIGEKGDIKIEITLINNTALKGTKRFTPFVVALGTTFNNSDNKNIAITNGKTISTGNTSYTVALSAPGIYSYTNLKEFKNLDKIIITYETENFNLNDTYIVASPKVLEKNDLKIFNKLDSLVNGINEIEKNMTKLKDGANKLNDGVSTLYNSSKELSEALKKVNDGVQSLNVGSARLNDGLNTLYDALLGAKKMVENSNNTELLTFINETVKKDTLKIQELMVDPINNAEVISLLTDNLKTIKGLSDILTETKSEITEMLKVVDVIKELKEGSVTLNNGLNTLNSAVSKLYHGSVQMNKGITSLSNGSNSLYKGIDRLNNEGILKLQAEAKHFANISNKTMDLINKGMNYKGFSTNSATKTTLIYKIDSVK